MLCRTNLTDKPLQLKVKEPAPDDLPADITSALCGRWLINQKGGDEYGCASTACASGAIRRSLYIGDDLETLSVDMADQLADKIPNHMATDQTPKDY